VKGSIGSSASRKVLSCRQSPVEGAGSQLQHEIRAKLFLAKMGHWKGRNLRKRWL
jgi:hypothetical protein